MYSDFLKLVESSEVNNFTDRSIPERYLAMAVIRQAVIDGDEYFLDENNSVGDFWLYACFLDNDTARAKLHNMALLWKEKQKKRTKKAKIARERRLAKKKNCLNCQKSCTCKQ